MNMKWFDLPGAKEAYIKRLKLRWVNDTDLDVPWLNFSITSPKNYDFFFLAFPDQAWIMKQIQAIDDEIQKSLEALEPLLPNHCKFGGYHIVNHVHNDDFFDYYLHTFKHRQRDSILHYAGILNRDEYVDSSHERLRLETFKSACTEFVETACLKDRARLIEALFSPENTAPLLSIHAHANTPFMAVRGEVFRRGLAVQRAMDKLREALGMEEAESEVDEDGQEDEGDGEKEEDGIEEEEEEYGGPPDHDDCGGSVVGPVDQGASEIHEGCHSAAASASGTVTAESQCGSLVRGRLSDGPAIGCATCGVDCGWMNVADGNESLDC
jgi:hypothetical protein